jgi:hypothetical protein
MHSKENIGIGIESGPCFMLLAFLSVFVFETLVGAVSKVINLGPNPVGIVSSNSCSVVDIKLTVPR